MKISKEMIRQIAREQMVKKKLKESKVKKRYLKEDEQTPYPTAMRDVAPVEQKNISLDQAVDRYFVRYEREAIPTSAMYENAFKKGSLTYLFEAILKEQEDLGAAPADAGMDMGDDSAGDLGMDDPSSEGGGDQTGAPMTKTPRIDINNFAMSIARLVNNYESLIDPKSIILNRAQQYITNNYDERTGKELMDILSQNFDLKPVTLQASVYGDEGDQFPSPNAAGSGGGGSLTAPTGGGEG